MRFARPAAALLMLALWLAVGLVSASPSLHRLLHPDSEGSSHECLLTHASKGHILSPGLGETRLAAPDLGSEAPQIQSAPFALDHALELADSRAPPASLLKTSA